MPALDQALRAALFRLYGPLQGILGSYLESSIETVIDIQTQTGEQSSRAWSEFMQQQAPVMQDLMRQYVEQSKALYLNTQNLFGLFAGKSPGQAEAGDGQKKKMAMRNEPIAIGKPLLT